ncbi:MAG: hypothetical protein H6625_00385 [Bdellovibrionaceae bacterium]|nr:hypothetical protein [Pseudobdellovibrionaceae bacterium]
MSFISACFKKPKEVRLLLFSVLLFAGLPSFAANVNNFDTFLSEGNKCLSPMLDRYIWVRGKDVDWKNRTFKHRYKTASQIPVETIILNGPWGKALIPTLESQSSAVIDSLFQSDTTSELLEGITVTESGVLNNLDAAEKYLKQDNPKELPNLTSSVIESFGGKKFNLEEFVNSPDQDDEFNSRVKDNGKMILAACAQMSLTNSLSCTDAVNDLLKQANYNSNFILPSLWHEFATKASLKEAVIQVSLILASRVKSGEVGNVLDDFSMGFQKAGFSKPQSIEYSWRLLALYGNGGSNLGFRIASIDSPTIDSQYIVSSNLIGTLITYLEFTQVIFNGTHYALPKEVSDLCLTPKPYHFWLSAYFARWLRQKGYSTEVSRIAPFIVAKGYQLNRDVNNAAGGIEKILSKSSDHPTNEVIRLDLALSASGSVFGSILENEKVKPFSLSGGLTYLQEKRGYINGYTESFVESLFLTDKLKLFTSWNELFQPNEAFEYFNSRQR